MNKPLHCILVGTPGEDEDGPGLYFAQKWFRLWELYETLHKHAPNHLRVAFCTIQDPDEGGLSVYAPPPDTQPAAKDLSDGLFEVAKASDIAKIIRWHL